MIAIGSLDFNRFGCPYCGCDYATSTCYGFGTTPAICGECKKEFVVLANGMKKSSIGFGGDGNNIAEYPDIQKHPRYGIPSHKYESPDIRPDQDNAEFWSSRGIGYDLSGFVKSKQAGERLLKMVKEVLCKDDPSSWLDYRENEPKWIQFKFQKSEFNLNKLEEMVKANNEILTKDILIECKL